MGCQELIDSLRKTADERIRQIWREAEEEGAKIRADTREKISALRDDNGLKRASLAGEEEASILSDASRQAREIKLTCEKVLGERLLALAREGLASLRKGRCEDIFGMLVNELPPLRWRTVRVNPADVPLAGGYFPWAEIRGEGAISGGVDVSTEGEGVRAINTFEKRLERAWADLLPGLIREVYNGISDRDTP